MSFSEALVYITAIASVATVAVFFIRSLWPAPDRAELEQRSLQELALVRDELSQLRSVESKDYQALQDKVITHERAIVNLGLELKSTVERVTAETSKLSMMASQFRK